MIQPVFAIPSHARSDKQPTLEYLRALGVPPERVYLCTWDNELLKYQKWKPYVHKIIPTYEHNHGAGLNTLLNELKEHKYILFLDDDLIGLSYLHDKKLVPITDGSKFFEFVSYAFTYCLQKGAKMWGIYPIYNAFFMKNNVRERSLLTSHVMGIIYAGMQFDTSFPLKADYDYCLRSLKQYGKTLRFEYIAAHERMTKQGGCFEFRTGTMDRDMGYRLLKKFPDCSMPCTFDTYSVCSYNCLYCFAYFQKSHSVGQRYLTKEVGHVDLTATKKLFRAGLAGTNEGIPKAMATFLPYIHQKKIMQWGGLADAFDDFEKERGVSLQLLQFFDEIDYPLSISTKSTWWTADDRYMQLLRRHNHNWHFKISIITSNPIKAAGLERGVDPPAERINAVRRIAETGCHITLRLRPYIIGVSDDWRTTIKAAADAGADSVTTEFFCLETRANADLKAKYTEMSKFCGYNVWDFYRQNSKGSGYKRLNRQIKEPIITAMRDYSHALGLRFYVSDAHHKEKSDFTCCCGVPDDWNISRGHFAQALQVAKNRGTGLVYWNDIKDDVEGLLGLALFRNANGFNSGNDTKRSERVNHTLGDFVHEKWNSPQDNNSPYTYFGGVLYPYALDKDKNVVYKYNKNKAEGVNRSKN